MSVQPTTNIKHHIVFLEEIFCPVPTWDFHYTYTGYHSTTHDQVAERLKDATIAITITVPILPSDLDKCPNLKCVLVWATGHGFIEQDEYRRRGVTVINTPQANVTSVAEHTIALYFASRRKIVELQQTMMQTDEWAEKWALISHFDQRPLTASTETMVIYGYGALGKQIEKFAHGLSMGKVLIAERKGVTTPREGRVTFDEGLRLATTVIITVPKEKNTVNMIDEAELKTMRKEALLINVARGGIVNEKALVKALREKWIAGAATDVFEVEPAARGKSPLLDPTIPNLTVSPHIAWYSETTYINQQRMCKEGLEKYVQGNPVNVVVQGQ